MKILPVKFLCWRLFVFYFNQQKIHLILLGFMFLTLTYDHLNLISCSGGNVWQRPGGFFYDVWLVVAQKLRKRLEQARLQHNLKRIKKIIRKEKKKAPNFSLFLPQFDRRSRWQYCRQFAKLESAKWRLARCKAYRVTLAPIRS